MDPTGTDGQENIDRQGIACEADEREETIPIFYRNTLNNSLGT